LSASPSTSPEISEEIETLPSWKQEVNAKLSAHRTRRSRPVGERGAEQPALPGLENARLQSERQENARQESRAAKLAAKVAERYAKAPSYSEMLAAEAANAARAAEAAAQAAREAQTAAQAILTGLGAEFLETKNGAMYAQAPVREENRSGWEAAHPRESDLVRESAEARESHTRGAFAEVSEPEPQRIQYHVHPDSLPQARQAPSHEHQNRDAAPVRPRVMETGSGLVEDPFEDAFIAASEPLPGRVLEFPRELIAARKARPRYAEGPLSDVETEPGAGQLRIFEVEPDAISHQPLSETSSANQVLPEWHSIQLDARPDEDEGEERPLGRQNAASAAPARGARRQYTPLLEMLRMQVAPMEDRIMAGIVDTALVLLGFMLFILVFAACTAHPPSGKPAMAAAGVLLVAFFALYQWLFFAYAEGTPGMRYAKIALCTFDDENPTRKSMKTRVGIVMLSVLPLGMGFFWALLDDHRMTWHDRITRTYQRSYR
jgi:RDD family